ncbi:hypothetical protein [Pantoea phage LIMEzero]|uniref:Uncharacterized protein n=1 Tax=Pantoea phage LIMEzero TaxID=943335 RepID=F4N9R7_9CAUD|nr:hypothetical protein LIMEzero_ORF14 [Pantoea phage LIMEzero]CBY88545.1 hypothetical protein [Pantoea phage LIMEzero]
MQKLKEFWRRILKALFSVNPQPVDNGNPFVYVTVETADLELGDYLVAYDGYIQRISAEDYRGQRRVVTKKGHGAPYEFIADEGEEFTVRQEREVL